MTHTRETRTISRQFFRLALTAMFISIASFALITNSRPFMATSHAASPVSIKPEADSLRQVDVTSPFTLTRGQTARLNFFNAGDRPADISACFLDADGRHLRMAERSMTIAPGQTRTYDISFAEAGPPAAGPPEAGPPEAGPPARTVRGAIHADTKALEQLVVSAEVFDDATGKTNLFVPGASKMRKSGGDPKSISQPGETSGRKAGENVTQSLAPVSITFGQKLRLMVFNAGSRPMEVEACFLDADGEHIVEMGAPITLAPGQTRWIEISRTDISLRNGLRALVRGAVHISRSDSPYLIAAGVIVHELTGEGSLYVPAAVPIGGEVLAGPPDKN